jgi:hypothetical protein
MLDRPDGGVEVRPCPEMQVVHAGLTPLYWGLESILAQSSKSHQGFSF